jgi:ribulose-5-phosphate 4-epimerase/fuculose-1-phosphate aldolase
MSLKASLCDYLSKQGSGGKCEEIQTYMDKWDMENIKSNSELSKLEMLIEGMKLNGNLLLHNFFWKWIMCEHWIVYWGKRCS